ncbi:MAG: DUF3418 domain-containing protein, partial [Ilumatobacteraceae bacterium]
AWERVTMSGIVVVPRRQTAIARADPKAARAIFIREGLAQCKWKTDEPFMVNNRRVLDEARQAEAKLRRRNVLIPEDALAEWFDERVPGSVVEAAGFEAWRAEAERKDARVLWLSLAAGPVLSVGNELVGSFGWSLHTLAGFAAMLAVYTAIIWATRFTFAPQADGWRLSRRAKLLVPGFVALSVSVLLLVNVGFG